MAKDPAFLFYPGDYLKDTQCLSEPAQVAYDRIMCEHMRHICITQDNLNFFTKRLTPEQKSEVMHVLKKVSGGFQIEWVADSILKRRKYSDSRRKNREGKGKESTKDMKTYVPHMENENEVVIENVKSNKNELFETLFTDDAYIEGLSITHRGKDIKQAFEECYIHFSNANAPPQTTGEWKQKLNTWLSNTKHGKRNNQNGERSISDLVNSGFGSITGTKG